MKITEWLSRIADFVNLGKLVVNTSAGTVLAVALALFAAHQMELPVLTAPVEGSAYQKRLDALQIKIDTQSQEFQRRAAEEADKTTQLAASQLELERFQKAIEDLEGEDRRRAKGGVLGGPTVGARLRLLKNDLEETQDRRSRISAELETAKLRKAEEENFLKELYERRNSVRSEEVNTLSALFTLSMNHLVALLLVGWLLGTIINPISNTFLLSNTRFTQLIRRWVLGVRPVTEAEDCSEIWERFFVGLKKLGRTDIVALVNYYPASYFVGLKVVAQTELDELIVKNFRWLELASQLLLPMVVLIAAISWRGGLPWFEVWLVVGMAWLLVGLLVALIRFKRQIKADKEKLESIGHSELRAAERKDWKERWDRLSSLEKGLRPSHQRSPLQRKPLKPYFSAEYQEKIREIPSVAPLLARDSRLLLEEDHGLQLEHLLFLLVPLAGWLWVLYREPDWQYCPFADFHPAWVVVVAVLCWSGTWLLHRLVRDRRVAYEVRKRSLIEARLVEMVRDARQKESKEHELVVSLRKLIEDLRESPAP